MALNLEIEPVNEESDFNRIVTAMTTRILAVGDVNYQSIEEELHSLQKPLEYVFNPEALANELAKIQARKDRAIEIVNLMTQNYLVHKRVSEVLTKGWTKYSSEKSAEKREGEALLKMSNFLMAATDAEVSYRKAMGIMRNLESQQENVSRQIACAQAAAKINDPRYAFDRDPFQQGKNNIDEDGSDKITNWDELQS